jgi:predicted dehydrogenase
MSQSIRAAVVGTGYFGGFHAEKLARLPGVELVAVVDKDEGRANKVAAKHGVEALSDPAQLVGRIDAAIVAVPTKAHFEVAALLLENGIHVLIEKPITDDEAEARQLIALAKAKNLVLQVGHLERFSAVGQALRNRVHDAIYIESYRITPFGGRGTDVSVILDLMIHDIDLILTFVQAPIESVDAIGIPVISDSEDVVNTRVRFKNGCFATMTASRVSFKKERNMRIFQPEAYTKIDFLERSLRNVYKKDGPGIAGLPNVAIENETYEEADSLYEEDKAFIAAVANGTPPLVSGEDGLRALEAAKLIMRSLQENMDRFAAARGLAATEKANATSRL